MSTAAGEFENILSNEFTFLNQVNPETVFRIRGLFEFVEFRKQLKELWSKIITEGDAGFKNNQELCDRLANAQLLAASCWESVGKELREEAEDAPESLMATAEAKLDWRIPNSGFGINNVYRLLLTHSGRTDYLKSLPMAVFARFLRE
jgi:hypothetical protein